MKESFHYYLPLILLLLLLKCEPTGACSAELKCINDLTSEECDTNINSIFFEDESCEEVCPGGACIYLFNDEIKCEDSSATFGKNKCNCSGSESGEDFDKEFIHFFTGKTCAEANPWGACVYDNTSCKRVREYNCRYDDYYNYEKIEFHAEKLCNEVGF